MFSLVGIDMIDSLIYQPAYIRACMIFDQILEAAQLFVLGMGTVFSLLLFLIFCIGFLSSICKKLADEEKSLAVEENNIQQAASSTSQEIAAATIAVNKYRQKR